MATTTYTRPNPSGSGLAEVSTVDTSAGAGDAGAIPSLDGTGRLDGSFMPTGIGDSSYTLEASENLDAGDLVNVFDDASTPKVRKADASNGRVAHGYVTSAVLAAASATVFTDDLNDAVTGLTAGLACYLSTAGGVSQTIPTTSGHSRQYVGQAVSATAISINLGDPIVLA